MRLDPLTPNRPAGDSFNIWVPLEKASTDEHGDRIIEGIASTPSIDLQGESVLQNGLDISYLKSRGFVNWEHGKNPSDYIGEPIDAQITQKGLWIKAKLFKNQKKADDAWELAQALDNNESSRRLGYSIQGKVTKRDGSRILKAEVHHVALTPQPVNPDTFARIAKSILGIEDEAEAAAEVTPIQYQLEPEVTTPLVIHQLVKSEARGADGSITREYHPIGLVLSHDVSKALTAGSGTDSASMSGGRATVKEDLECDKDKKKKDTKAEKGGDDNDNGLKVTTYKSLSQEEASAVIRARFGNVSDELCNRIISYATKL